MLDSAPGRGELPALRSRTRKEKGKWALGSNDTQIKQPEEISGEDIWRTLFGACSGSIVRINPDKYYEYSQDRPGKFQAEGSGKLRWRERRGRMRDVAMQPPSTHQVGPADPVSSLFFLSLPSSRTHGHSCTIYRQMYGPNSRTLPLSSF
jgi:hypothetical protein